MTTYRFNLAIKISCYYSAIISHKDTSQDTCIIILENVGVHGLAHGSTGQCYRRIRG